MLPNYNPEIPVETVYCYSLVLFIYLRFCINLWPTWSHRSPLIWSVISALHFVLICDSCSSLCSYLWSVPLLSATGWTLLVIAIRYRRQLLRRNFISILNHWRALFRGAPHLSFVTYFVTYCSCKHFLLWSYAYARCSFGKLCQGCWPWPISNKSSHCKVFQFKLDIFQGWRQRLCKNNKSSWTPTG